MNDYPIAANAETIRLITFSAWNRRRLQGYRRYCRPNSLPEQLATSVCTLYIVHARTTLYVSPLTHEGILVPSRYSSARVWWTLMVSVCVASRGLPRTATTFWLFLPTKGNVYLWNIWSTLGFQSVHIYIEREREREREIVESIRN